MSFQSKAKAYTPTFRCALVMSALKIRMCQTSTDPGSIQQTDPSVPSPPCLAPVKLVGYHSGTNLLQDSCCAEAMGRKVKYRGLFPVGATTCRQVHVDVQPYQQLGGDSCAVLGLSEHVPEHQSYLALFSCNGACSPWMLTSGILSADEWHFLCDLP